MGNTCTCGRTWTHCRICGGKNVYRMQMASMESGYDTWKCKKCMIATNELSICKAPINHEVKEFVSKEKAIRDLAKIPLEERLKIMIAEGASVDEVQDAIRMAGLEPVDETKEELVIQKAEPNGEQPKGLTYEEMAKLVEEPKKDDSR